MSRGIQRERDLRRILEEDGWWTMRSAASKGCVDVVALKAEHRPRFIQVKSDKAGPFAHFGPKERAELLEAAGHAGAEALLCHWPPRAKPQFLGPDFWP